MKRIMIVVSVLVSVSYGGALETIKSDCTKKWGTDYKMVEYCVKRQVKAVKYLASFEDQEILSNCAVKWKRDFKMVKYCADRQLKAKRRLGY